jgi:hypothetical protein
MPRVTIDSVGRSEAVWQEWVDKCADGILRLEHREFVVFGEVGEPNRYVQIVRDYVPGVKGEVLQAELGGAAQDGGPAEYTASEQVMINDLGWASPDAASPFPNYSMLWSPEPSKKDSWLNREDAVDAAEVIARTLRGPLAVASPKDIEVTNDKWDDGADEPDEISEPAPVAVHEGPEQSKLGMKGILKGLLKAAEKGLDQSRWSESRQKLPAHYVRIVEAAYDLHQEGRLSPERFAKLANYDIDLLRSVANGSELPGSALNEGREIQATARQAIVWMADQ